MPPASDNVCKWVNRHAALQTFATYTGPTQSQLHIKPLHHYVACRLVLEGGFSPERLRRGRRSALRKAAVMAGYSDTMRRSQPAANEPCSAASSPKPSTSSSSRMVLARPWPFRARAQSEHFGI